jgi:hypothetical protein
MRESAIYHSLRMVRENGEVTPALCQVDTIAAASHLLRSLYISVMESEDEIG